MQVVKLLFIATISIVSTVRAQSLPQGEGRQIVADTCGQCHPLGFVTDARHTREQWVYIVSMMITMGAPVPGDKITTVVDYLSQNFGKTEGLSTESAAGEK